MNHIENDGLDVFYRVSGLENGFPIIFVHGIAGDSRFFHNQLRHFGSSYRIIAIDLPGHGKSSDHTEQSIDIYNRSIEAVIKKEQIETYALAGHSMGGAICLENYLRHKDKVKVMILISTSSVLPVDDEMIKASIYDFDNFFYLMLTRVFHKKAGIFILAAQRSITDKEKQIITGDLKLCSDLNYDKHLENIEIPVLLIANKHDRMIPSSLTEDMQKKIKNSKLVLFDDEGHIPFFENSKQFNNTMREFIESIL